LPAQLPPRPFFAAACNDHGAGPCNSNTDAPQKGISPCIDRNLSTAKVAQINTCAMLRGAGQRGLQDFFATPPAGICYPAFKSATRPLEPADSLAQHSQLVQFAESPRAQAVPFPLIKNVATLTPRGHKPGGSQTRGSTFCHIALAAAVTCA